MNEEFNDGILTEDDACYLLGHNSCKYDSFLYKSAEWYCEWMIEINIARIVIDLWHLSHLIRVAKVNVDSDP